MVTVLHDIRKENGGSNGSQDTSKTASTKSLSTAQPALPVSRSLPTIKPRSLTESTSIKRRSTRSSTMNSQNHVFKVDSNLPNNIDANTPELEIAAPEPEQAPKRTKSDSSGFLSSILSAAHNAVNTTLTSMDSNNEHSHDQSSNLDHNTDENPKKKEHSFSSKLDFLLKPAKFASSKSSINDDQEEETGSKITVDVGTNKSDTTIDERQPSLSPAPTSNIQFESVRESPLNSMGQGDLSLHVFEKKNGVKSLDRALMTSPSGGSASSAIRRSESINRRLMISPNHSTENVNEIKRSLSPDVVNRQLPLNNQLAVSGSGETKRVHRRSVGNSNVNLSKLNLSANESTSELLKVKSTMNEFKRGSVDGGEVSESSELESDDSENEELNEIVDYSKITFASQKRNKEVHHIFKKIPLSDKLIDDCSCALSRDILVQGRMYILGHYICFKSNILGWVTNLTIPLQEVIQIEKKSTAVLFPNGIIIRTLHHKFVFATFLSRDSVFNLITTVWHRVLLEGTDIDGRLPKRSRAGSKSNGKSVSRERFLEEYYSGSEEDSDDDVKDIGLDEDIIDRDTKSSKTNNHDHSGVSISSDDGYNSDGGYSIDESEGGVDTPKKSKKDTSSKEGGDTFNGFPMVGPKTHEATETDYTKQAKDTFICDDTINAPLGAVFQILFGSDTSYFIKILKAQKNFDISELEIEGLSTKNKERTYSYIKPLSGPIGPKQTKCLIEDKLIEYQMDKFILVEEVTQTPDVPSGSSFKVNTKIYLSWGPNNSTKIYVVTAVEWSAKSWIKGAIEKGSIDGQKESMKIMLETLNEMVSAGDSGAGKSTSKLKKKKSRSRKSTILKKQEEKTEAATPQDKSIPQEIMALLSLIGKLVPIPFIGETTVGGIITLLVVFLMFRLNNMIFGRGGNGSYVQMVPSDAYVAKIKINNEKYLLIPSMESNLANKQLRMENEISLWNWVKERSDNQINIEPQHDMQTNDKYSDQEIREIVKITQMKLDGLRERLNID